MLGEILVPGEYALQPARWFAIDVGEWDITQEIVIRKEATLEYLDPNHLVGLLLRCDHKTDRRSEHIFNKDTSQTR